MFFVANASVFWQFLMASVAVFPMTKQIAACAQLHCLLNRRLNIYTGRLKCKITLLGWPALRAVKRIYIGIFKYMITKCQPPYHKK